MIQTLKNAWKIQDLRRKILFTLLIILLYRVGNVGNAVPVPYINRDALASYFESNQGNILGLYNMMSGGAFSQATIFALSIQPYINASIIIQLLCIAIPALERLSKEGGEEGRKKIASITRYATVGIGLLMGFAYYMLIKNSGYLQVGTENSFWVALVIILTFTSGSALIMWLGEQITEFGIGNGISMILFASIVSRLPRSIIATIENVGRPATDPYRLDWWVAVLMFLGALAIIRGRPEDVRRPEHLPAHEGEHVRRYAHHLRLLHRHPARHHRGSGRRQPGQLGQHLVRQQLHPLCDYLLPADHLLCVLLFHHPVQSH